MVSDKWRPTSRLQPEDPFDAMPRFPADYYDCRFSSAGPVPAEPFAIVTAWNPMDQRWSGRMNRAADHRLRRLLERKHLPHQRITCMAADATHAEPGWAVRCDLATALSLGRRFKQRALWWIEDKHLHLVACDDGFSERVALRESWGIPPA